MHGISSPEVVNIDDHKREIDIENEEGYILINLTAEFDKKTIRNIEKLLNSKYREIAGQILSHEGIDMYFFEPEDRIFQINFMIRGLVEQEYEIKENLKRFIKSLGGIIII